jgi:hypothetical protein
MIDENEPVSRSFKPDPLSKTHLSARRYPFAGFEQISVPSSPNYAYVVQFHLCGDLVNYYYLVPKVTEYHRNSGSSFPNLNIVTGF